MTITASIFIIKPSLAISPKATRLLRRCAPRNDGFLGGVYSSSHPCEERNDGFLGECILPPSLRGAQRRVLGWMYSSLVFARSIATKQSSDFTDANDYIRSSYKSFQ
jgi:hypothetical protein